MTQLDPARWERLAMLLEAALEQPPDARATWVASRASDDPSLAAELAAMLAASDPGAALCLERELLDHQLAHDVSEGTTLGPYRILRLIGRGGMGEVHLAERADGVYEHQVAVKVLRAGVHGHDAISRFHRERRILARLAHPAVVPLLDGGVLPDGRPYLVLQYVDGVPITRYADAQRLAIDERLRLAIRVCRAVEFAHARLIVHRDLKPSNILVTRDGSVRLLDFGIAKLLDEDEAAETGDLTRQYAAPMTTSRAAPEQLRGEPPTTATDVWALGVLLHELLTGRLPYATESLSPSEAAAAIEQRALPRLARSVCDEGPAPPSDVAAARSTTPSRLVRALSGDIEIIVAKALQRDPERRYQQAGALADDIAAVLDQRPIAARPDSWWYRTRRFAGRHRAATAAALTMALTLGALSGGAAWQARAVARALERAETEAASSRAIADVLVGLLRGSGPKEGAPIDKVSVAELMARGISQAGVTLGDRPEILARVLHTLASIHVDRSELPQAIALFERAVGLTRAQPPTHPDRVALLLDYAQLLMLFDRTSESAGVLRPVIQAFERGERDDPALHAAVLRQLASAVGGDDGVVLSDRAISLLRTTTPIDPVALASALDTRGGLELRHRREPKHAQAYFREALALVESVHGRDHPDTMTVLGNLAAAIDEPREAVPVLRRLIELHTRLLGSTSKGLAFQYNNLGVKLILAREYREGEAALREAQARWTQLYGPSHEQTVNNLRNIARALELQGRLEESDTVWRELEQRLAAVSSGDDRFAQYAAQRAQVLRRLGRFANATSVLTAARRRVVAQVPAQGSIVLSDVLLGLGDVARDRGEPGQAVALLREALAMRQRLLSAQNPAIAEAGVDLARTLAITGDAAGARQLFDDHLARYEAWPLAHADDVAAARDARRLASGDQVQPSR